ncbi:MAG TPA: hypothetical protein VHG35_11710, partial [Gemmatimonadales bacterium]|nr:hypothetical protein [Gemmatimonadales bacterium]
MTASLPHAPAQSYGDAFPNSTKVYVEGSRGIRVPMREIALTGGERPLRVYDTSGPLGRDARDGLPSVRGAWIAERVGADRRTGGQADGRTGGRVDGRTGGLLRPEVRVRFCSASPLPGLACPPVRLSARPPVRPHAFRDPRPTYRR